MPNLAGAKRWRSAPKGRPGRLRQRADHVVDGGGDDFGGLRPVDQPELALPAIVVDQWRCLVEEDVDPVGNDIRAIIAALVDLGPGCLGRPARRWRTGGHQIEAHAKYLDGQPIASLYAAGACSWLM